MVGQGVAVWLARAIRATKVSSLEVVRAHLEHIHTVNPRLNAVVFATAESALQQARAADRRNTRKNDLGPLHGVPFTAKDIFETKGLPTTAGLRMLRSNIPDRDATVVARMREAGAILIGKTNCPPGGAGGISWNPLHGGRETPTTSPARPAAAAAVRRRSLRQEDHLSASVVTRAAACACRRTTAESPPSSQRPVLCRQLAHMVCQAASAIHAARSVSYTHLTLPTICSV